MQKVPFCPLNTYLNILYSHRKEDQTKYTRAAKSHAQFLPETNASTFNTLSNWHYLSNLLWILNTASLGFCTVMKTDSSRRLKQHPQPTFEFQFSLALPRATKDPRLLRQSLKFSKIWSPHSEKCCLSTPRNSLNVWDNSLETKALVKKVKTCGTFPWSTLAGMWYSCLHQSFSIRKLSCKRRCSFSVSCSI